jgi:hypothetical protein
LEKPLFDTEKDPKLERIVRNFNRMDPLLQDYVTKNGKTRRNEPSNSETANFVLLKQGKYDRFISKEALIYSIENKSVLL